MFTLGLFGFLLWSGSLCFTQDVQRPENTAVAVGEEFSLTCVIPSTFTLEWVDEFGNGIAINNGIYDSDYTVVYDEDAYHSNLTAIDNLDMSKGKRHYCAGSTAEEFTIEGHAQVIILENSKPNCMPETTVVIEDYEIQFSCEMAYNGSWAPLLTFKWEEDGPDFDTSIETNETLGLAKSTVNITASVEMSPEVVMQCTGMFEDVTDVPEDHADNTPEYDFDICTMQITVHVPITEDRINISAEDGSSLYEGTSVTCSADDIYPEADSIEWTDEDGSVVSDDGTFVVGAPDDYVYTCTITTTVGSVSSRQQITTTANTSLSFTSFATTVAPTTTEELTTTSFDPTASGTGTTALPGTGPTVDEETGSTTPPKDSTGPTTSSGDKEEDGEDDYTWLIVSIVTSSMLLIAIIIIVILILWRRKRQENLRKAVEQSQLETDSIASNVSSITPTPSEISAASSSSGPVIVPIPPPTDDDQEQPTEVDQIADTPAETKDQTDDAISIISSALVSTIASRDGVIIDRSRAFPPGRIPYHQRVLYPYEPTEYCDLEYLVMLSEA